MFGGQRYSASEEHYYTREALDSVETYDLRAANATWTLGPQMPASLYNTGCLVMPSGPHVSVYVCGTTERQYSGSSLFWFMYTSVFRLDLITSADPSAAVSELASVVRPRARWTVVEHDVSEVKAYYRCVAARLNTSKLIRLGSDIRSTTDQ